VSSQSEHPPTQNVSGLQGSAVDPVDQSPAR